MKKNVLAKRILFGLLLIAVVLICVTGFFVSTYYEKVRLGQYERLAFSYTRTMADMIDGDRIEKYLRTGETDKYFFDIQKYINAFAEESDDIWYTYIVKPGDDDFVYIWCSGIDDPQYFFLEPDEYGSGMKEILPSVYKQNPEEKIYFTYSVTSGYIATVASPIFDSEGNPVALACADIFAPDIEKEQRTFVQGLVLIIGLIILMAYIVIYLVIQKKILKPIEKINSAARSFVKNIEESEQLNLDIHTKDEIEGLSKSFEEMSTEIKAYINTLSIVTAEQERIETELALAAEIQLSALPAKFPAFPAHPELDLYATMSPAKEVGGDFYDFFAIDDDHIAIVMADVSGKGVPAALFMMTAKSQIKSFAQQRFAPSEVLKAVNAQLCANNKAELFITAWLGVLEVSTGKLTYVNAGHCRPLLHRKETGEFCPLDELHGVPLACFEDTKYDQSEVQLRAGDALFLYTDGVTEATNLSGEMYGTVRLSDFLNSHSDAPLQELLPALREDIDAFVGEAFQFDDITMLMLRL